VIDQGALAAAICEHDRSGDRLGSVLTRLGFATEEQIAEALASQLGFPFIDLATQPPDPLVVPLIPRELAQRAACIAVAFDEEALVVAMADPLLFSLVQELETLTARRIKEVVATQSAIAVAIEAYYPAGHTMERDDSALERDGFSRAASTTNEDAVALVDRILGLAAEMEGADVHVEPAEGSLVIRARTDGILVPVWTEPIALHEEVVARLKLLAGLDVAERLLPQAGKIELVDEQSTTLRLATLRTTQGEKIVLRPLGGARAVPRLDDLGLSRTAVSDLRQVMRKSNGLVIVAGPHGSGRSTTVAALLVEAAAEGRVVASIERAHEYRMPGVTQMPVDESIELSIGKTLTAAIGEKAEIIGVDASLDRAALKAVAGASGGRLVVAVVTADDAAEALTKIAARVDDPTATFAAVRAVVGQRLVRRLCSSCRRERTLSSTDLHTLHIASADVLDGPLFDAVGCDQCGFTGYRGRIGIFEVVRLSDVMRLTTAAHATTQEIRAAARAAGVVTLAEDARSKLESTITSIDELRRSVGDLSDARSLCAQCGTALSPDFSACPHCGAPIGGTCQHCGRALQRGWNFCPFCARAADNPGRPANRAIMRLVRNSDSSDPV
jgi:type IV pilus assembly protein PilB